MSGATIISPYVADTTLAQDGQAQFAFTLADLRQIIDSLSAVASSTQTASYTFIVQDRGTRVRYNSTSSGAFTIPPSGTVNWAVNTVLMGYQANTGQLAFSGGTGVTLNTPASLTSRARYSHIWAICDAVNVWTMGGDLT